MEAQKKRAWAEVSLDNLRHNYLALRELIPQDCKFMGMVKADAYGHGAIHIAGALQKLGADYLGVACLDEAMELRNNGITMPILILGATAKEYVPELLKYHLTQTVFDVDQAAAYAAAAKQAKAVLKIHIKADIGMSRLGFQCDDDNLEQSVNEIVGICADPVFDAEGIFTHFPDAEGDEEGTMHQFSRFLLLLDKLRAHNRSFRLRHCANSGATLAYPCTYLDMVRPGIALYGHFPDPDMEELCDLKPVMSFKTRVSAIRTLPEKTRISYGGTHTLTRNSKIAVISVGYGDGLFRGLSNQLMVSLNGNTAPVLGKICMDMCMVDVTDLPDTKIGDIVTIYGEGQPIEVAAAQMHTISYELLCAISKRIPRLYR
ncbi:MAG: alanine racemase [Evtepia sp.]